jgi:membrane-associated HD superfamily phosphohydrolase
VVMTFALLGDQDIRGTLELIGASVVSAGGSAVVAVGSFAAIGSLFGILTVFQLLELANPSQPVLRRLLVETPGTYHHSLMVGNLAERAAESIGAPIRPPSSRTRPVATTSTTSWTPRPPPSCSRAT